MQDVGEKKKTVLNENAANQQTAIIKLTKQLLGISY